MKQALRKAWDWFASLWRKPSLLRVVIVRDLPTPLAKHTLYVVEDYGVRQFASLACPCGCGTELNMNLLPDDEPQWRLLMDLEGLPTLTPSVWRKEECGSHFFIRSGRIEWCRND